MSLIPTSPDQITKDWLAAVLKSQKDDKIEVLDLKLLSEKNGVMSTCFKATVKINEVVKGIFLKTALDKDDRGRQFSDLFAFGKRETFFYTNVIEKLVQFEEKHFQYPILGSLVPKFYCGDFSNEDDKCGYFLVFEDISKDYQLRGFEEGMTKEDTILTLKKLAKFHALSFAFIKDNQALIKSWNLTSTHEKYKSDLQLEYCFTNYAKMVDIIAKEKPKLRKPLEHLREHWYDYFDKAYFIGKYSNNKFFIHGDFWLNNIMCSTVDCKFIDWEDFTLGDPALDLGFFLASSISIDNLNQWEDELLQLYLETFEGTCAEMKVKNPIDKDEFVISVKTNGCMAIAMAWIIWFEETFNSSLFPRALQIIERALETNLKSYI